MDLAIAVTEANSLDTLSIHVLEAHLCKCNMLVLDVDFVLSTWFQLHYRAVSKWLGIHSTW